MKKDTSMNKIWFLGRSYKEYLQMFDLTEDCLKKQNILDIAAGASSFTPRLSNKGYKVKAADILYDIESNKLEKLVLMISKHY